MIAENIVALRRREKISQEKLAELSGVHRTYISQIERGLKSPTLETIFKICFALKIKPNQFIKDIEDELHNQP